MNKLLIIALLFQFKISVNAQNNAADRKVEIHQKVGVFILWTLSTHDCFFLAKVDVIGHQNDA